MRQPFDRSMPPRRQELHTATWELPVSRSTAMLWGLEQLDRALAERRDRQRRRSVIRVLLHHLGR